MFSFPVLCVRSLVLMVSVLACGASARTSKKVRIAGLKGPTTMGLVNLLSMEKDGTASLDYDLKLYGAADEIVPKLIKGDTETGNLCLLTEALQ